MALETAALGLGKAVGTRALHTWLTSRAGAESRGKDLVELMRSRFPDQLVRRKAERQIEDVADAVTARVLKVCAHEFAGLGDDDRVIVLAEVTATLARADLSDRALLAADADPVRLSRAVRESLPAPRDLGEAASRLYEVVLDECCDCLVRIVRHLPEFGPRAAAETLARLSGVGEQIAAVLDRLPVRTLEAPDGTDRDVRFRRRYLEHVSRTLDSLELLGVRIERFRPRTSLSVAYISLSVSAARGRAAHEPWDDRQDEPATMRVESALGQGRRMLLRGEAGGGKSTLLRWLAITAARGGFEGELASWNGCVPFLVKLRSYADRELPRPERFLDLTAGPLAGLMPAGWAHRELAAGRALLLIDGVDELTGSQRRSIRPWLRALLAEFPATRVVITSRPSAAGSSWLDEEGFAPAFLERMTPSDTRALVEHWHEAIRSGTGLPCPPEHLPVVRARLLAHLDGAAHLRALAATPLLAAMLCALNLDRASQLPPDRMGLYAAALEMLLHRRDAERTIPSYGDLHLDRAQKTQVLQELAWQLSVTNRVELAKPAALARVEKVVAGMPRVRATGAQVLDYLLERSGVLREPVEGRVDFVHRTVQEYLTARAAAEDGDVEPLVLNAHRDQWREVVVMAAGHANAPLREELLRGLLARMAAEPRHARRLKVLVCACLETLPSVPAALREAVDSCLDDLVPPRDAASARSLAAAGPVVLDRLPAGLAGLSAAAARACVRTAWLVNGPRALDVLARYATDERPQVQGELIEGWRYFEPGQYASRVLASMTGTEWLTVHTAGQFDALRQLPPQSRVSVEAPVTDLGPLLVHRESLSQLALERPVAADVLREIRQLTALMTVHLMRATDLGFLAGLRNLTEVSLDDASDLKDLTPLHGRPELRELQLLRARHVTRWDMLPDLGGLIRLALSEAPVVASMRDLVERAPKLISLELPGYTRLTDLDALAGLSLRRLDLSGVKELRDLSPLAGCTSITVLRLNATPVRDLRPVATMSRLRYLHLMHCLELDDLSPLAALHQLRSLMLVDAAPGLDLAPLAGLRRLTVYVMADHELRNGHLLGNRLKRLKA
ncbi:NACHT N-terminal Helical domain 1-containing protein [Nonomuraea ceibae]|uniref:NACHT N-terminal Helical domain 1-containing protein n=1 Tax=Nonomuraea ceibae TaxID=1935170 RepID=UPI001C5F3712|nr:NACHT domain-containing protein [Nonomuraea ceibae]